ncbi:MAG: glycosyltransferase family 4 protein [Patescibacteria group bacterium]
MFGWEYPPNHLGGLGVACQGLVRGLSKHGVLITLVLPHAGASEEENVDVRSTAAAGCMTVRIQSPLMPYDSAQSYRKRAHTPAPGMQSVYGDDLAEAVERFTEASVDLTKDIPTDIVHCHDWMTYEAGTRTARTKGKPLVAHIHATELDRTHFSPNEWIFERERRGFENADRIIAVSGYTKNLLIKHYGIPADNIEVVHNGISEAHWPQPSALSAKMHGTRVPLVLFLGRLTIQKGPWQFLDMAAEIHRLRPDVQFVVAGEGDMLPLLIERACGLGLADTLVFAGKVNTTEAKMLYAQADCFVMPSLSEPFGLVALEAVAHGTPIILSKQSGVAEVIDHSFKVDFWDTAKMADCVLTILREQPLALQLSSEAPRVLQRLTWENQAKHIRSLYEHILYA